MIDVLIFILLVLLLFIPIMILSNIESLLRSINGHLSGIVDRVFDISCEVDDITGTLHDVESYVKGIKEKEND